MLIKKDMLQRLTSLPSQNSTSQLDLAKTNYIYTASVMFRNHIDKIDMSPFNSCPVGDYVLFMLLSNYGKIMFLPETMGCYRMHNGGVWGKKSSIYQYSNWLKVIELLIHEFRGKVLSILIRQYYLCVCKLAAKQFFQYEFRAGVKTLKLLLKKF
jgi:hypothetical protein